MINKKLDNYIILFTCPDRQGIVAKITNWLFEQKVNIISMEEHVESNNNLFFMRLVLQSPFEIFENKIFIEKLLEYGKSFNGKFSFHKLKEKDDCAIFVTKERLPLYDLLIKHQTNDLNCNIKMVVSNHQNLSYVAEQFNIPFYHFPINSKNKSEIEPQLISFMEVNEIDLIILARYMQIFSPDFCSKYSGKVINIHHSFLPSFKGAKPYKQAYEKGVKIMGATAHYITEELDAGPIIEQTVERVDHSQSPEELELIGQDIESITLTRAVKKHLEGKVFINDKKTVVFD